MSADDDVAGAVAALRRGGVAVVPTDTVYGLCCDPFDPAAVARVFAIKGRAGDVPLAVLVDGAAQARRVVDPATFDVDVFDDPGWPGELTVVCPARRDAGLAAGVGTGGALPTLGVRRPASGPVVAVVREFGPVAATSANRHGAPTPTDLAGVRAQLGSRVDAWIDGGTLSAAASAVVAVDARGWRILRAGSLGADDLTALLGIGPAPAPGDGTAP